MLANFFPHSHIIPGTCALVKCQISFDGLKSYRSAFFLSICLTGLVGIKTLVSAMKVGNGCGIEGALMKNTAAGVEKMSSAKLGNAEVLNTFLW